ncbi:MAG: hypothetical protein HY866_07750 [Chloroflexi bacterium]|nr:hypothetical protein [Chloroflexota bacterium]
MLPDNTPKLDPQKIPDPEIEPISPQEAETILQEALDPYLAEGWHILDRSAYTARLTREMRNLDLRVDLLGRVEKQETGLTPLQDSGRLTAWVLLLAALLVTLALTSALGIL